MPPIPLFALPDTSILSTAGLQLRRSLQEPLKNVPGVTVKAATCSATGEYVASEQGLLLYGDGSGSYTGPSGTVVTSGNGSGVSSTPNETVTRDGKGGGTYSSATLTVTVNRDGSGTYSGPDTTITLDGRGSGTYSGPAGVITVDGDGGGTHSGRGVTITNDGDGGGTYSDGRVTITNDGRGKAQVVGPTSTGEVDAAPLPPVPKLGKFPPVGAFASPPKTCGFVITLADAVLFDFDKSDLRPEGGASMDAVARALAPVGAASIAVAGHTDAIGTDTHNQALSETRARTVADALRTRGVKGTLSAKGFGESRPVAPNELNGRDNPAGRQLNRRVEIFVKA